MGCGQGKTSAPAPVQDKAPVPTSTVPQSPLQQKPMLLGNETTPHEKQDGNKSGIAEPIAESSDIATPSNSAAEFTFTLHKGCMLAGNDRGKEVMTVAEAKRQASELPGCGGFCFTGVDEGGPVEIFFTSGWKLEHVESWTAFKLEPCGSAQESKSLERNAQQTDADKPKETVDSLPAEAEISTFQAVSQPAEASQEVAAPVAPPSTAEEQNAEPEKQFQASALDQLEAACPENPSQTSAHEEREDLKASAEKPTEKPVEKAKRLQRQMCCC